MICASAYLLVMEVICSCNLITKGIWPIILYEGSARLMKKIWSVFFVVLLSLIPLLGTNAEEMNPDDNVMFSESFEVSVQEIECVLYEDKFAPKKEIEAPLGQLSISEPDLEYAAGLIQPTMTSEGDFEVVNGILKNIMAWAGM